MKTTQYVRHEKAKRKARRTPKLDFDTSWYVEQLEVIAAADYEARRQRVALRVRFDPGHLYVVAFDSGVIKVGKAGNAESRLAAHAKTGLIRASWTSPRHLDCSKTERQLIAFCNEYGHLYGGREYFTGIAFDHACAYAFLVVRNVLRRAYLDSLIDAVNGDMTATWAQARRALGETAEGGGS